MDSLDSQLDVVFLHGLLGGLFYTWRQIDHDNSRGWGTADLISSPDYSYCWPKDWFKEDKMDQRGVRVIGVDFVTYLSQVSRGFTSISKFLPSQLFCF